MINSEQTRGHCRLRTAGNRNWCVYTREKKAEAKQLNFLVNMDSIMKSSSKR